VCIQPARSLIDPKQTLVSDCYSVAKLGSGFCMTNHVPRQRIILIQKAISA
jgi:hypothetical protein